MGGLAQVPNYQSVSPKGFQHSLTYWYSRPQFFFSILRCTGEEHIDSSTVSFNAPRWYDHSSMFCKDIDSAYPQQFEYLWRCWWLLSIKKQTFCAQYRRNTTYLDLEMVPPGLTPLRELCQTCSPEVATCGCLHPATTFQKPVLAATI